VIEHHGASVVRSTSSFTVGRKRSRLTRFEEELVYRDVLHDFEVFRCFQRAPIDPDVKTQIDLVSARHSAKYRLSSGGNFDQEVNVLGHLGHVSWFSALTLQGIWMDT